MSNSQRFALFECSQSTECTNNRYNAHYVIFANELRLPWPLERHPLSSSVECIYFGVQVMDKMRMWRLLLVYGVISISWDISKKSYSFKYYLCLGFCVCMQQWIVEFFSHCILDTLEITISYAVEWLLYLYYLHFYTSYMFLHFARMRSWITLLLSEFFSERYHCCL